MKTQSGWIAVGVLSALVVASAFAVVAVRHLNRIEFYALERLSLERDELSIEWRQLMTEKATWRMEHSVEEEARNRGEMRAPAQDDMQVVVLPGGER